MFTPELAKFYSEVNKEGLEIVFVSFDHDAEKAMKYIAEAHGNWLYLLPEDQKVKDLSDRFSVDGIPTLIVVKPDGSIITNDGRSDVSVSVSALVIELISVLDQASKSCHFILEEPTLRFRFKEPCILCIMHCSIHTEHRPCTLFER